MTMNKTVLAASIGAAFSLTPAPTFAATVDIPVPGGGDPKQLRLIFKHKDEDQLNAFLAAGAQASTDAEWLLQIVSGWEAVDAEFSPENFALLLRNYHGRAANAILDKYLYELTEYRRGN